LGTPTQNGTLVATNGLTLNFGRNIAGRGQVQSTNTLAKAVIINGAVVGDSSANPIEFTGYVKGVGTFNNVAFSGTFSPGLSPTLSTVDNVLMTPTSVLEMEIGGTTRGSQYDAFEIETQMTLAGTLKVTLIDAYVPKIGDRFVLFQGPHAGTFDSFDLVALDAGRRWDTSGLATSGELTVVAVPEPGLIGMITVSLVLVAGMRRAQRHRG
jgi:hypothetical protein